MPQIPSHRARHARRRPRLFRAPAILAVLSLVAATIAFGLMRPAAAAEVTDGLAVWYKMDETSGAVATDSSGNNRNGTVNGTAGWGPDGLTFNGTNTYVKMPDNLLRGMTAITVSFDVRIDPAQAGNYFIYGIGNTSGSNGNGYLFATGNSLRTSLSLSNWTGEQNTQPSPSRTLARGGIKHLDYTQSGTTGVLYEDGTEVARNTNVTVKPGDIGAGTTTADYIGRSLYSGDAYFTGTIRDFRIYNRALDTGELGRLWQTSADRSVQLDQAALSLGDTGAVTTNVTLPAVSRNGSALTWSSSDPSVVGNDGTVTRPALGRPDATVTLTATIKRGASTATKTFSVTVLADFNDSTKVNRVRDAITVPNIRDVRGNLALPTTGDYGTTITWKSASPQVIAADGVVHRPAAGSAPVDLNLIATVTLNQASASRTFQATVPPLPAAQPLKGYLFSYFTGEGTATGEQIYNAVSRGNDPLHFREVNGGKPVLTSTLGTKGLRDPFIIRSPEGDKFYQIATDLRIFGNGNWDASQRTGSKSIMVWESTDLVHWTDQRLVKVSPDSAGNTWAPEAFYDDSLGSYVVFWASKIYAADDPNHTGSTYNKMMYATTRDFYTFSTPKVWKDPGYSVIDSTMIKKGDSYYRFTKDERNSTSSTPCSKFIIEEKSASVLNLNYDFVAECLGKGTVNAAEGPLVFKSNTENKWYLFLDEFGGRGYVAFESTNLDSGVWTPSTDVQLPASPRHGTVLPVTQAEYDLLLRTYSSADQVTAVAPVNVTTTVGHAPVLPTTVTATYADASTKSVPVTWEDVPASAYAKAGSFTVRGSLGADVTVPAIATVTVRPANTTGPLLRYEFEETAGTVVHDSSGNGNDGTYQHGTAPGTGVHGQSATFDGGASGSTTARYVSLPKGILAGTTAVTVSMFAKWSGGSVNQWLFGLGPDSDKYLFATPANGSSQLFAAITKGSWQNESKLPGGSAMAAGKWTHVAVTVDTATKTAVLYVDGLEVARAADVPVKPADLNDTTKDFSGYIARSLYGADPYLAGQVDDFRIYDRALTADEIRGLSGNTAAITSVTLPELKVPALIDQQAGKVLLPVREGTDLKHLAPAFGLVPGATISPASGTVRDLSSPVTYHVVGADGLDRAWIVQARVMRSPVLPGLNADPNIAVFGDTYYMYPTTDGFDGWSGTKFHAFSSKDLLHWQDRGVILDLGPDVSWADSRAWAPTITKGKNGKYYFYFCADGNIGVAVASSPAGPFTDAIGKPLVAAGSFAGQMIDPDVFVDDDGSTYLYFGNGGAYVVKLNADLISYDKSQVKTITPSGYNEGSFVFKRKGVYYFSWSENDTRDENYRVAYATGDSPYGPWTKRGVILSKNLDQGIKGTGHHSVLNVPGTDDWYMAYHRFAIPGGDGMHRETTIDRMEFNADGTIKPVVPTLESVDPEPVPQDPPPSHTPSPSPSHSPAPTHSPSPSQSPSKRPPTSPAASSQSSPRPTSTPAVGSGGGSDLPRTGEPIMLVAAVGLGFVLAGLLLARYGRARRRKLR